MICLSQNYLCLDVTPSIHSTDGIRAGFLLAYDFAKEYMFCCFDANFNDNFSVCKMVLTVFKWNVQRKAASLTLETKVDLASFAADPAEPDGCCGAQVREGHSAGNRALSSALPSSVFIQVRKIPPEESGGLPGPRGAFTRSTPP